MRMKCLTVVTALCIIGEVWSQQLNSLSAMSLIAPQVDFFSDMCFNRTGSNETFDNLKKTLEDCQSVILNGTELTLTYNTLVSTDPKEFLRFYTSQCNDQTAVEQRDKCNDNFKFHLKQCLNETELIAFNKIEDIALRVYKVICDMDQEKMKHFFSEKGQECLSDNVITIGFCFMSSLPDDDDERKEFLFNLIEGKECKVIEDVESCMMGELDVCDEKSISHIFKLLFDFFKRELKCWEPEQETKRESSSGNMTKASTQRFLLTSAFIALFSRRY